MSPQPSYQCASRTQRPTPLNRHTMLGPCCGCLRGLRAYHERQKAGDHHQLCQHRRGNRVDPATACGINCLSNWKHQSNPAPSRSRESERSIRQNYARSLVIGFERVLCLWVSRRQAHGPSQHLHSQPVSMEPEWAMEGSQHVVCSYRNYVRILVL